jgi:hypothetical protein
VDPKEKTMSDEKNKELEIEEITGDELEDVAGGTCDTCGTCAGCSHSGCMGCGALNPV